MFDFYRLSVVDQEIARMYIGGWRYPDLVICPEGHGEYLFRWHVVERNKLGNVYFHIQTKSDPERPLHDHPWDSVSVILSGGYDEIIDETPYISDHPYKYVKSRRRGAVIHRPATWAHRLILPYYIPYSMSLFTTGPKVRDWGFWMKDGWKSFSEVTEEKSGTSIWKGSME